MAEQHLTEPTGIPDQIAWHVGRDLARQLESLRRRPLPHQPRHIVGEHGHPLRRWFCGLPSATPYCQAGIFHGENDGIPAFRFYDKAARRVVTAAIERRRVEPNT